MATVFKALEEAGVRDPLIQRRIVTLTVASDASKRRELLELLRESDVSGVSQAEDLFSGESVIHCTVTCEEAEQLVKRILRLGISKVLATESYEVFVTSSQ